MSKLTPSETAVVIPPMKDAEKGALLTEQYDKACNAMPEILRFGAMMIQLEHDLVQRGQGSGNGIKGDGVKGWLEKHAPKVSRPTAYRFRDVTLGIAEQYKEIVGDKVARQYALADLVTTEADKLPEPARKKQQALFDYVAGTSQKSWLDKIKPAKERGGNTSAKAKEKKKTAAQQEAELVETLHEDCAATGKSVTALGEKYRILDDAKAEGLAELLEKKANEIREWLKLPKNKRPVLDTVKAITGEKH